MNNVVEIVTGLAKPILAKYDCYLYDLEFVKEGKTGTYEFMLIRMGELP